MKRPLSFCIFCISVAFISAVVGADYREPVQLTENLASEALDPALMCLSIYCDARVTGWEGPLQQLESLPLDDPSSGFHAGLYQRSENGLRLLCLTFRGTELTSAKDWKTDFLQALGEEPEQYQLARERSQTLKAYALHRNGIEPIRPSLAGHSLGAGLAAFGGLCWRLPSFCFASAPLGSGTQHTATRIHPDSLRTAPTYLTHLFMRGDLVPDSTLLMGGHFGRVVDPELDLPGSSKDHLPTEKLLGLLDLAGLDMKPLMKKGTSMKFIADKMARHSCVNYVQALLAHACQLPDGLDMIGYWKSQGSFFSVSSTATCFALKANGTLTLQNEITVLGEHNLTLDQGRWHYDSGRLKVYLPNLATLEYELVAHEASKAVQWQRVRATPDREGFLREWQRNHKTDGRGALLLLESACLLMKGKRVSWFSADHDLFSDLQP